MKSTNVALVGLGTVGSGVARILFDHDQIVRHAGRPVRLKRVVVRDAQKPRTVDLPSELVISEDLTSITRDPDIDVVAQLVGGIEPARTIMLQLLESGKDIVTANKALLAEHGSELFDRARQLGRSIAFEASVAGGVPIITNIGQCLSANQLRSLRGILNGTSNFIVSQMEEQGADYAAAVAEAQELGYAEADPSMDVDGTDAAQKLAILAHLAFGADVPWREIPRVGIDSLDTVDLRFAADLGYRIKLLAVAQLRSDGLEVHVSPTLVKCGTPLAEVRGAYNAIRVVGNAVGRVFFHGLGAGEMPTASAVVADLVDTIVGRTQLTFRTLQLWSDQVARVDQADPAKAVNRYYIRLTVDDNPGVLSDVAGILGLHRISISSVIQPEQTGDAVTDGNACLVIMTHKATEGDAQVAIEQIRRLSSVREQIQRLNVLD